MADKKVDMDAQDERYETLDLEKIDVEYYGQRITKMWDDSNNDRSDYLDRREERQAMWRSLEPQIKEGPWESSSNYNVPIILTYGKAIHARLWQLFADRYGFFDVSARREAYKDRELPVKEFMNFVWNDWANNKAGCKPTMIDFLWNLVFDGSGICKLVWRQDTHRFLDRVPVEITEEKIVFDRQDQRGRSVIETRQDYEDQVRTEVIEYPEIVNVDLEDFILPIGQADPQTSDWVATMVECSKDDLKIYADQEKFDADVVKEIIELTSSSVDLGDKNTQIKQERRYMDGYNNTPSTEDSQVHKIIEWYGKAFVEPEYSQDDENDLEKVEQEVVMWVHAESRKVLGWTYLYRIAPDGKRPLFKADLLNFPNRSYGVGVAELLADLATNLNAIYNLRVDNGTMATLGWGVYRGTSGLKPDTIRISPGELMPVDDVQDIRMMQFPYLGQFGQQEEQQLTGYAEKLLSINELNLGAIPNKVGALRNATGSNLLASESSIQLQIHFDRLAYCLDKMLQSMFRMCRTRMPEEIYYRVTGDLGQNVFGKVARQDLEGEYDFKINLDILGQSRVEKQQQATLTMQTLMNPAFMQTGIVQPQNLYEIAKTFLKAQDVERVDKFITAPEGYDGETMNAGERFFRISAGLLDGIVDSVRLNENHEKALKIYEAFKANDAVYGLLSPEQVAALEAVIERHQQMLMAQQAPGNPNNGMGAGSQLPQGGMGAGPAQLGGGGDTLQAQQTSQGLGTPNGPMV